MLRQVVCPYVRATPSLQGTQLYLLAKVIIFHQFSTFLCLLFEGQQGFSEAKADLSIAVLSAIKNNPSIRNYWIRKRKEKCGGIVLNAIKFKLVLRMFAVIKRGTPYVETDAYKN